MPAATSASKSLSSGRSRFNRIRHAVDLSRLLPLHLFRSATTSCSFLAPPSSQISLVRMLLSPLSEPFAAAGPVCYGSALTSAWC